MATAHEKPLFDPSPQGVPANPSADWPRKRCESCLSERPLELFRRRYKGREARVNQCRLCHNELERYRRAAIRHRVSRREMAKAMTQFKKGTAAARVPVFCREMVQHFGGADGFLEAWKSCIDKDLEKGGLPAFRHIAMLLKFMEFCEPEPVDYSVMTDAELLERLSRLDPDADALP